MGCAIVELMECDRCQLSKTRTRIVGGYGDFQSFIMFIGEAPGAEEDIKGEPFVGKAGKYLNELLNMVGLKRKQVRITNVVKCRPPNNRDPFDFEIEACLPWLREEIRIVKPKVIVTLGRFAASHFFPGEKIAEIHGTYKEVGKTKIFASYHPASALYGSKMKKVMEEDFRKLKEILDV